MTIVETRPITGGVDTHLDVHVAAALDANGGVLGVESFATTTAGFAELHAWLCCFGSLERVGVEGTGAYGAGLARFLRGVGVAVIEVDRPNRQARRRHGKSDTHRRRGGRPGGAVSGRATAVAKTADGNVEAIRVLLVAYRSGRDTRIKCLNQLRHLGFTAPDELRERFRGVRVDVLARQAAGLRPNPNGDPVVYATKLAMHTLGRRVIDIDADCAHLHGELTHLVERPRRACSSCPASASTPPRCCWSPPATTPNGSAPRPPSPTSAGSPRSTPRPARPSATGSTGAATAKPTTPCGASCSPAWARTHAPAPTSNARLAEGRSKPEIMRVLKRYVAREVYRHLPARSATIGAAGLAPEMPARHHGCPANDLPTRRSTPTATPPGLIRACPRPRVAHHWSAGTVAEIAP